MSFVNITPTTAFKAFLFCFTILEMVKPNPALITSFSIALAQYGEPPRQYQIE